MTIRPTTLAALAPCLIALFGIGAASYAQQATIRPSPQAPVSPNPRSDDELDAYFAVQNEPSAANRLRLANNFLSDYFDSEFRHLILRIEWAARGELQHEPRQIIEVALAGIEAQDHFLDSKLTFIDDPSGVDALPGVRYTLANQKALYYQSITESYNTEGDFDHVVEYGELALDALSEALRLYEEVEPPGTPEYERTVTQSNGGRLFVLHTLFEGHTNAGDFEAAAGYAEAILEITPDDLFVLHTLMRGYQEQGDVAKIVELGEAILQVTPDDLDTLRTVSLIMSEGPPEDPAAAAGHFARARTYAEEAVRRMTAFLEGPDGSRFSDDERAAFLTEVHTTLGMIHVRLEEWPEAVTELRLALQTAPTDAGLYYTLALASNGNRDLEGTISALARAAYLGSPEPQVRTALAAMYESVNGSTDGLEEFIEMEGEQIDD
jgi:tetratricopeptide (TPR) repeat protein